MRQTGVRFVPLLNTLVCSLLQFCNIAHRIGSHYLIPFHNIWLKENCAKLFLSSFLG